MLSEKASKPLETTDWFSRRLLQMKPLSILALVVPFVLLAGCQSQQSSGSQSTSNTSGSASSGANSNFKVALLTLGPVDDAGWNALAYNGLQAVKTQVGADVNNQVASGTQIKDGLRSYAQKGYNLVIGHGYEFNAPAFQIAKDFPKTDFVTSSGSQTAANLGTFRFYLEQGFYLAGMMAAKMSKTGVIAEVGGDKVPPITSTFDAFEAGAKAANPQIKVLTVYTGNGNDVAAAKRATESVIAEHADFVIHQADNAAQGVFDACAAHHVYAFGANANQNTNPSGIVIASAVINAEPAFVAVAKEVKDGTFKGSVRLVGMETGAIEFDINPAFQAKVPPAVLDLLKTTEANIKAGKLVVPKLNF